MQRNARTHIPHIALLASLKNLVIWNGGSTFLMSTFMEGVHFNVHPPYLIIACFTPLQALMFEFWYLSGLLGSMVFKVCNSSLSCLIYILKFHCLENSTSIFGKYNFTLLHMISQLYLYSNGYSVVVLMGSMFATIIYCIVGLWPITKWYIIVVTWALVVCLMYTLSGLRPVALGLQVYISAMLQL